MKPITYTLIAVFIFGIIAMGLTYKPFTKHTIFLQSTDSKISSVSLSQSADIISMRLKSFGTGKFEIKTLPDKNQIRVILTNYKDLNVAENLITQKGILEFYETYDYYSLTELLKGDSNLMKQLHVIAPHDSSARIGYISATEMNGVNEYLNSAGLNEKCKFAWSNLFDDPNVCLYALRIDNGHRISLTGNDIQSFELKHDATLQKESIEFKFKKTAIQLWSDVTKRNLNRAIAIVMDNNVIYAPVVRSEINGGNCEITGDFTQTQVRYIVAIGDNGVLPVSFRIVK
jgi:preprotein translocase subunit SecD